MNLKYHFVNVVWGRAFTETFLEVCLPSTLTAGNLGVFGRDRCTYRIYTTAEDAATISKSSAARRLAEMAAVELRVIPPVSAIDDPNARESAPGRYETMAGCHNDFIRTVGPTGAAMVFLAPDLFMADGSLARLAEIAESGKRAVLLSGMRLTKEDFIATLRRDFFKDGNLQPIDKRALVRLAFSHLHPETKSAFWDGPTCNSYPSTLLWRVGPEEALLRAFHLHPLMVRPQRMELCIGTLDDKFVANACPNPADIYVVEDSDDVVAFELSKRAARNDLILSRTQDVATVAKWAQTAARYHHQQYVDRKIRLHGGDRSGAWPAVERASDRIIKSIRSELAIFVEKCAAHATALLGAGRAAEAIQFFAYAAEMNPRNPDTHFNFGVALYETGSVPAAEDQFRQALRLKPGLATQYQRLRAMQPR